MSDYTSTWSKVTGNTIEVADFTTELNAIATASATKQDIDATKVTNNASVATTSGTAVTISSAIPTWASMIFITLDGVSLNSSDDIIMQLGDSGGFENSGYQNYGAIHTDGSSTKFLYVSGISVSFNGTAGDSHTGIVRLIRHSNTGNEWIYDVNVGDSNGSGFYYTVAGSKTTDAATDRIQITTDGGSATFDAGSVSIKWM